MINLQFEAASGDYYVLTNATLFIENLAQFAPNLPDVVKQYWTEEKLFFLAVPLTGQWVLTATAYAPQELNMMELAPAGNLKAFTMVEKIISQLPEVMAMFDKAIAAAKEGGELAEFGITLVRPTKEAN